MPRVTGPFMSLTASGSLKKTIVASIWKGRPYMRIHAIPINRNTVGQQGVRSILGTLAKAVRAVLTLKNDTTIPAMGSQFFIDANAIAPAGQSWLSYLQKVMNSAFGGFVTSYGVLDSTHKGYWVSEGSSLGLSSYTDKSSVVHTAGEQLYMLGKFAVTYLGYTGFASGIDAATSGELTTFGTYVQTSA